MNTLDLRFRKTPRQRKFAAVTFWCALASVLFGYLWWLDMGCTTAGIMTAAGKVCT